MTNTTNTTNTKIFEVNSFETAERDACRATAEDWMYDEVVNENGIETIYFIDPSINKRVAKQITIQNVSVTLIDLEDESTWIWKVA